MINEKYKLHEDINARLKILLILLNRLKIKIY